MDINNSGNHSDNNISIEDEFQEDDSTIKY